MVSVRKWRSKMLQKQLGIIFAVSRCLSNNSQICESQCACWFGQVYLGGVGLGAWMLFNCIISFSAIDRKKYANLLNVVLFIFLVFGVFCFCLPCLIWCVPLCSCYSFVVSLRLCVVFKEMSPCGLPPVNSWHSTGGPESGTRRRTRFSRCCL